MRRPSDETILSLLIMGYPICLMFALIVHEFRNPDDTPAPQSSVSMEKHAGLMFHAVVPAWTDTILRFTLSRTVAVSSLGHADVVMMHSPREEHRKWSHALELQPGEGYRSAAVQVGEHVGAVVVTKSTGGALVSWDARRFDWDAIGRDR